MSPRTFVAIPEERGNKLFELGSDSGDDLANMSLLAILTSNTPYIYLEYKKNHQDYHSNWTGLSKRTNNL